MQESHILVEKNPYIEEYVTAMSNWIKENSQTPPEIISELFAQNHAQIEDLFKPYPETIFHDDPSKWAELLAINWGVIQERELEFA